MKKPAHLILVIALVLSLIIGAASAVLADWEPGDPGTKWVQLPDVSDECVEWECEAIAIESCFVPENGEDVDIMAVVADDFLCTETGLITDIHVWGSWFEDYVPDIPLGFLIVIYDDIPDPDPDNPEDFSMPGQELWSYEFGPDDYDVMPYAEYIGTWVPCFPMMGGSELTTEMYQYNFYIPEEEAFEQEQGTIYWLSVMLIWDDFSEMPGWGWNIARYGDQWNDDAILWYRIVEDETIEVDVIVELRYPDGPHGGQSIDLAFAITTTPSPESSSQIAASEGDTVGGEVYPVGKATLLAPWIALAAAIVASGIILVRRRAFHSK